MIIREYRPEDEWGWVRCRVLAFLDTSYCCDVKTEKEKYLQPDINLVAEENGEIVGLIDAELDSYDLALAGDERGAIVWSLAVLPEFQHKGVGLALWAELKARLVAEGIRYCEVWTQEDAAANAFYRKAGFVLQESQVWLRCRANAAGVEHFLKREDGIFGVDELVFNAPVSRREELAALCDKIDEVRLYSIKF